MFFEKDLLTTLELDKVTITHLLGAPLLTCEGTGF